MFKWVINCTCAVNYFIVRIFTPPTTTTTTPIFTFYTTNNNYSYYYYIHYNNATFPHSTGRHYARVFG